MEVIGIDLHKKRSRFVVMNQEGEVFHKRTIASSPEGFRQAFEPLAGTSARVALESTINWYWAVDLLRELGLDVHLANPHKVRLIAESTIKTDTVDATTLAHLLRMNWLPESRITPGPMRLMRERLRYRITLVQMRTSLKCRVHALLEKVGLALSEPSATDLFGATGRAWLAEVALPPEYRDNLDGYLGLIDALTVEVASVEKWLADRTRCDRDMKLLMGIPGIGRFGAALILAEIGSIEFFKSKDKLSSFLGVVSGAHNSDQRVWNTGLKKDSNKYVRWLLAEGATKAVKAVPSWQRLYERVCNGNDRRKGKARMAVMHKMAEAVWRVLTTRQPFDRLHNCPELRGGRDANGARPAEERQNQPASSR